MESSQIEEMRIAVENAPLYRTPLAIKPLPVGSRIILAGHPSSFEAAVPHLTAAGYAVDGALPAGAGKIRLTDALKFRLKRIPLVSRDRYPENLPYPVVFSGNPRKYQFSSRILFGQELLWLDGDLVKKKNSRFADGDIISRCKDSIVKMNALLEDDESRETFKSIIASRFYDNNGYLKIEKYEEYNHPLARVVAGDVVVDAGAHVGKVTQSFAKACGPRGLVYAFEPDSANFSELSKRNGRTKHVIPVQSGIWDSTTTLRFSNTTGSSAGYALAEDGETTVPVVSIDDFFSKDRRPPTVIKLDIEGAEAAAIKGAEKTILKYKPRLMISAYHKAEDLWNLLFQVKKIRDDYKFYLGHHNFYHTETDIYAI